MQNYLNRINPQTREYFSILSKDIPEYLYKYEKVNELRRLQKIGYFCGEDYCSKSIYNFPYFYSRFDHSMSAALITHNFTGDKTQVITALLHDISTPVFSHAIDYMNGDKMVQESTEERAAEIIINSKELLKCLDEDEIDVEDIIEPKRYNIVDNKSPRLCSDRLEGILTPNLLWTKTLKFSEINDIYKNILVLKNEDGNEELGTKDIETAKKIVDLSLSVGYATNSDYDKVALQLLADITRLCIDSFYMCEDMLYFCDEEDIVGIISNVKDKDILELWKTFTNMKNIMSSDEILKKDYENNYYVSFPTKKRYVDPLTISDGKIIRVSDVDKEAKQKIEEYKNFIEPKYAYVKKYK